MDLNQITTIAIPRQPGDLGAWTDGDAWLAGGTWLFSEPQPGLRRLVDLSGLGWDGLDISTAGLRIGATCTIATLEALALPDHWAAAPLVRQCCRALLGSFKIWNMATVGGNICMALPAGPMTSLATALDAVGTIFSPRENADRALPIIDLVTGPHMTSLRPGEVLRRIDIAADSLTRRTAFRRISLSPVGRSAALVIGTRAQDGAFALTVTAATRRPVQLTFAAIPDAAPLAQKIEEQIPETMYFYDMHGRPDWRRHMTFTFAEEIRRELGAMP